MHEDIVAKFNQKFVEEVDKLTCGLPWDENVQITPLPEPHKPNYINQLIVDAEFKGAKVINDNGNQFHKSFVSPTVLYPVNETMRVYHEEQFGPVVPILSFKEISEPLAYVSNSNYGQQVSLFSESAASLAPLIDVLVNQVSRVNINSKCQRGPDVFPFVGRSSVHSLNIYPRGGLGRFGFSHSFSFFVCTYLPY